MEKGRNVSTNSKLFKFGRLLSNTKIREVNSNNNKKQNHNNHQNRHLTTRYIYEIYTQYTCETAVLLTQHNTRTIYLSKIHRLHLKIVPMLYGPFHKQCYSLLYCAPPHYKCTKCSQGDSWRKPEITVRNLLNDTRQSL